MRLWDKQIYVARREGTEYDDNGNEVPVYGEPFELYCNVQPLSGSTDILAYGERVKRMYKTLIDYDEWVGRINEGDIAYIHGASPEGEAVNGENANCVVDAALPQNLKLAVFFEKLQKGVSS